MVPAVTQQKLQPSEKQKKILFLIFFLVSCFKEHLYISEARWAYNPELFSGFEPSTPGLKA
jgi:hypothetical protein